MSTKFVLYKKLVRGFALATLCLGLAGNTSAASDFPSVAPHKFEADKLPEASLTNKLLFQLIASEVALHRNELGAAYKTYMNMAESTNDPRLAERAAQIAKAANDPKELQRAANLWLKLAPGNEDAQELMIHLGIYLGEYSKVRPLADSFLAQTKKRAEKIDRIQNLLLQSKNKKEALAFFKKIALRYKNLPETRQGLARLELMNEENGAAVRDARIAYNMRPSADSVILLAAALLKTKPQKAEPLLESFLERHPKDQKVKEAYAQLLVANKKQDKLIRLAKRNTTDGPFTLAVALHLLQNQNPAAAESLLKKYVQYAEYNPDESADVSKSCLILSDIALDKGDFAEALSYAGRIGDPDYTDAAALQMTSIYTKEGDADKALFYLNSIRTGNPERREEIILTKTRLLSELKGDMAALDFLKETIEQYPNSRDLYYTAALKAESVGDINLMRKYFKESLRIDPKFSNAYNSYGYCLLIHTDEIDEAAKNIRRAFELDPKNAYILDSMGWLAFKQGNLKEAENYLSEALDYAYEEEVVAHLAEVKWKSGQPQEALKLIEDALEVWPNSNTLSELKKEIKAQH